MPGPAGRVFYPAVLLFTLFMGKCDALLLPSNVAKARKNARPLLAQVGDAEAFCAYPSSTGDSVEVFIGSDNRRKMKYAHEGPGLFFTEVACKGPLASGCIREAASAPHALPSCETLSCPCDQDTSSFAALYHQRMIETMPTCNAPAANATHQPGGFSALTIGLGGGALHTYLLAHCAQGTKVESVEYDPRIVQAAVGFFGLALTPGVSEVEAADGGRAMQARIQQGEKYDAVFVDCFAEGGVVPDACRNASFIQGLHGILKPGGKAMHQVWESQVTQLLQSYKEVFGPGYVQRVAVTEGLNYLIVATTPA